MLYFIHHLTRHHERPVRRPAPLWLQVPLYLIAAVALFFLLTSCSATGGAPNARDWSCGQVADAAVTGVANQGEAVQLLKVRHPQVLVDNRQTVERPKGDGEALVLSCTGAGVYTNGSTMPTRLRLTTDSDGQTFVQYFPGG